MTVAMTTRNKPGCIRIFECCRSKQYFETTFIYFKLLYIKPYILVIKEIQNMPPKKAQGVGSGTTKVVSEIIL
jgi:hypothetical protein